MPSECHQSVIRVSLECAQSVVRVSSECHQSMFNIEVISSSSASSVSFFQKDPDGTIAHYEMMNFNVITVGT